VLSFQNLVQILQSFKGSSVQNAKSRALVMLQVLSPMMLGMSHPEFSSMFQRKESAQRFAENQVADYEREDANTSYARVALYTLNFLDAYLKHDASAKAFLEKSPAENGVPPHFMGIKFRPAQKPSDSNTR
jgi:hypothetical protein